MVQLLSIFHPQINLDFGWNHVLYEANGVSNIYAPHKVGYK